MWLFKDRAEVTWAQVADLDCCHDSLDLGLPVAHFRFHRNQPDFGAVLECIRRQFSEPLTFRVFDDNSATVLVRDFWGELRELGDVGAASRALWSLRRRALTQEMQIRFTDPSAPPVAEPSGVDTWFGSNDRS